MRSQIATSKIDSATQAEALLLALQISGKADRTSLRGIHELMNRLENAHDELIVGVQLPFEQLEQIPWIDTCQACAAKASA